MPMSENKRIGGEGKKKNKVRTLRGEAEELVMLLEMEQEGKGCSGTLLGLRQEEIERRSSFQFSQ